jgi:cytochrome c-type biogenesis protein
MSLPESLFPALGLAAAAGLLSFLSPCVLPLVPAYLSYISGRGIQEIASGKARGRVLARSLAFILGFSLVFVALALAFAGGKLAARGVSRALELGAGLLVLFFGLNLIFDFAAFLNYEARFHPAAGKAGGAGGLAGAFGLGLAFAAGWSGLAGAFGLGLAFAAGWSPCIGPVLASILFLAARESSLGRSALLLVAYSAGLALPFLAAGLFFDKAKPFLDWGKRHARGIRLFSGVLLALLGALMASGRLGLVSGAAARAGFALQEAKGSAAARVAGPLFWLALCAALALPALAGKKRWGRARAAAALAFAGAALCELLGLFSTAGVLSGWLLFAGI